MDKIIGREEEIKKLDRVMSESEAQLVIVSGRRRVGKTFLINEYFHNSFAFKFTGSESQKNPEQLRNFSMELNMTSPKKYDVPKDWTEAFFDLREYLDEQDAEEKQVVFFDEMPWMDKKQSGFLPAFEWFWNSWGASKKNLVFIVCGSVTSWIVENFDENKGGLFNRQTARLFIEPFDLRHTEMYLDSRGLSWSRYDIVQVYMIMGGIPFYLRLLDPELTLNENIDNMFFRKRAELFNEFNHLYNTLFSNSEAYIKIVSALSEKRCGLIREEIVSKTGIPANGVLSTMLSNLEKSGFIRINREYGNKKRNTRYQLSDYYSLFYFKFIRDNYGKDERFFSNMNDNSARRAWAGLTFEQVCKDHISQIKNSLGIAGVLSTESTFYRKGSDEKKGAQVDLVIERGDNVVNLCEIKFSTHEYEIDKEYDMSLKRKVDVFRESTRCNKTIIVTMITTYGIKKNKYSNYVGREILMDELFI